MTSVTKRLLSVSEVRSPLVTAAILENEARET